MDDRRAYRQVGVIIPANNEQEWLAACVRSVLAAAAAVAHRARVHVVVVADNCTDETAPLARALLASGDGAVLHRTDGNVGMARAVGYRHALTLLGEEGTWLATTDADSRVPANWLGRQLDLAASGWHGVAGRVRVRDWHLRSPTVRAAFERLQRSRGVGDGHAHVHGANLGCSARAYVASAGAPPTPTAEDRALWTALAATGLPLIASGRVVVETSARISGRTAGGFSALLAELGTDGTDVRR